MIREEVPDKLLEEFILLNEELDPTKDLREQAEEIYSREYYKIRPFLRRQFVGASIYDRDMKIFVNIAIYLYYDDIINICTTDKRFVEMCSDPRFWRMYLIDKGIEFDLSQYDLRELSAMSSVISFGLDIEDTEEVLRVYEMILKFDKVELLQYLSDSGLLTQEIFDKYKNDRKVSLMSVKAEGDLKYMFSGEKMDLRGHLKIQGYKFTTRGNLKDEYVFIEEFSGDFPNLLEYVTGTHQLNKYLIDGMIEKNKASLDLYYKMIDAGAIPNETTVYILIYTGELDELEYAFELIKDYDLDFNDLLIQKKRSLPNDPIRSEFEIGRTQSKKFDPYILDILVGYYGFEFIQSLLEDGSITPTKDVLMYILPALYEYVIEINDTLDEDTKLSDDKLLSEMIGSEIFEELLSIYTPALRTVKNLERTKQYYYLEKLYSDPDFAFGYSRPHQTISDPIIYEIYLKYNAIYKEEYRNSVASIQILEEFPDDIPEKIIRISKDERVNIEMIKREDMHYDISYFDQLILAQHIEAAILFAPQIKVHHRKLWEMVNSSSYHPELIYLSIREDNMEGMYKENIINGIIDRRDKKSLGKIIEYLPIVKLYNTELLVKYADDVILENMDKVSLKGVKIDGFEDILIYSDQNNNNSLTATFIDQYGGNNYEYLDVISSKNLHDVLSKLEYHNIQTLNKAISFKYYDLVEQIVKKVKPDVNSKFLAKDDTRMMRVLS